MYRMLVVAVLVAAMSAGSIGQCVAQGMGGGGPLARLNRPLGPAMPGLPTSSPLGLIAPRFSNAVTLFQKGGMRTPAGRLSALGVVSPRVSPLAAMVTMPPKTRQARMMYGLTILSPRAAVLVGMLRGAQGLMGITR